MRVLKLMIGASALLACSAVMAGDPAAGESAFAAKGCTGCHGAGGVSTNPMYPSLNGKGADHIETQLKAFKSGARQNPTMSPMASMLSDDDVANISAYLGALK